MSAPHFSEKQYNEYLARRQAQVNRTASGAAHNGNGGKVAVRVSKWSETEKRYFYGVLGGKGEYEGAELRITPENCERHVYTPDFVTYTHDNVTVDGVYKVYHEVKGNYRLGSQDAARLRWCFAAIANDKDIFVWAKEARNHRWDIEVWYCGGRVRIHSPRGVRGFHFTEKGGVEWEK